MEEDLAGHGVVSLPDLAEMYKRVDCRKERSVEPSPALGHEFRDRI